MGVDFSKAKGFGNARPAGWYPITFEKLEAGVSKAGNAQLSVIATVREGDFLNAKFYDYLPLDPTQGGSNRTKKFIESFGYDVTDVEPTQVAEELLGSEAWVEVRRTMGKDMDGEPRMENRPVRYSKEDPGEPTPTLEDLAAIEAREESAASTGTAAIAAKVNAGAGKGKQLKKNGAKR